MTLHENRLTVETIREIKGFAALEPEWSALLPTSRSDSLFLTWEWLHTWYRHHGRRGRLFLSTVRKEGSLIAIAPLLSRSPSLTQLRPYPSLEFLGCGSVGSDYLDLIIQRGVESDALRALADCFARRRSLLELTQLRRRSNLSDALGEMLELHGWRPHESKSSICPYIDLVGLSWESYLGGLGSEHRYNFQRRLRKLQKEFDVRFEQIESESQRGPALQALIRLHNLRWRDRGGSSAFSDDRLIEFHDEFSRKALARGWLRLFLLRLNDRPAAGLYGFRYNDVFYFYQSGFDPELRKWSLGLVVMGLAIRSALLEGAREYDLLHGDEDYKFHWANGGRELGRLELYPPRLRGALLRHAAAVTRTARRTAGRVGHRLRDTWTAAREHMGIQRRAYAARSD